ncbi:MAG TPA: hypothetical protein PLE19_14475 [Planctomycetota bacterium]|nr:hypothetical protein [Planctomycetota bacterium]HRR82635.1 hypothetical protein [Planctomycetota bacterium]HRT96012.1 hypothetical protein [Planctomycetota bacterium]
MKRFLPPCVLLALMASGATSAGHFCLEARLRDGRSVVKGYLPEKRASFDALTADGKAVTVRFERLPDFAKRDWSQEIIWDEKLSLYVLRTPSWTGLLKRLWDTLELDAAPPTAAPAAGERTLDEAIAESKRIPLKGADVAEVKIRYIDPSNETIKPPKKR